MKLTAWRSSDPRSTYRAIGWDIHWWRDTGIAAVVLYLGRFRCGLNLIRSPRR